MLLLMSDNIDRCFESCPPRTFLPALCKIFLDKTATENVLEVRNSHLFVRSLFLGFGFIQRLCFFVVFLFPSSIYPLRILFQVTARAITYYLDVSNECTRRVTQVDGAIRAICNRLTITDLNDRTSKDLGRPLLILLSSFVILVSFIFI